MISDPVMYYAYIGGKVSGAGIAVGVEEKQRIVNPGQTAAGHRPVHNIVMDLSRVHIVDILRIIYASDRFPHTHKLACMNRTILGVFFYLAILHALLDHWV